MERYAYSASTLSAALREFEKTYGITTEAFYESYRVGADLPIPRFEQQVWASFHEDVMRMHGDETEGDLMSRVGAVFAAA